MADTKQASYRKHPRWHDYTKRGIYLITLVVSGREHIFGELNMDRDNPGVILTETGKAIEQCWRDIPQYQATKNRHVSVICCCVMPDHFHGVIFVKEDMDTHLGEVIQKFKSRCTQMWRRCVCGDCQLGQPNSADYIDLEDPITHVITRKRFNNLSKKQRDQYYSTQPRILRPLFEENYDASILRCRGQLQHMISYVRDNPRRAIYRKLYPHFFRNIQAIEINGRLYSAFGNLFLLKAAHKIAVKCHRKHPQTRQPYEETEDFQKYRAEIHEAAKDGSVIVTPGISKGEQIIRDDCFDNGYSIIHLQKEPFGQYSKPEKRRFDICLSGKLLIIIPLDLDKMDAVDGVVSTAKYSNFHNMNILAEEIADFHGVALIKRS